MPVLKQPKTYWLSLAEGLEKVNTTMGRELMVAVLSIQGKYCHLKKKINQNTATSLGYSYKLLLKDEILY